VSRAQVQFADTGEVIGYDLSPALLPFGTNALKRDDEIKHRLRMSGQDPDELTFEQRERLIFPVSGNGDKPDGAPHSWCRSTCSKSPPSRLIRRRSAASFTRAAEPSSLGNRRR
jgi:hypothetical protein